VRFHYLIVLLCVILSAGIASGADAPTEPAEQASGGESPVEQVDVLYLTLRNKAAGRFFNPHYGGRRDQLRAGVCSMEFKPIWGMRDIAESAPFYIPDQSKDLKTVTEWPESRFWESVSAFKPSDDGNIVLYIHGYNIGFEKSCRNAAIFQRALNLHDRLFLFSWPADGNFLKYPYDEADLVWSVPYLANVLEGIFDRVGNENLDVVAHSLGARGVVRALAKMACGRPATPLLNELILVAPDIDTAIFKQELPALLTAVKRITLYVSENDKALALSQDVHGYPRLGQAGEHLSVLEGIETIDISLSGTRRLSGHIYHLFNPAVIKDLTRLLATGDPASQRPGLEAASLNCQPFWRLQLKDIQE
jgi:esterase/lipase superfamily enzyme